MHKYKSTRNTLKKQYANQYVNYSKIKTALIFNVNQWTR